MVPTWPKKLKKTNKPFYEYLTNTISSAIYLKPPTSNKILNLILSLNDNKALGHDNIPAYFLKVSRYVVARHLKYFTNFIFNNRVFPNCKIAKVVPIFKNGCKEETYNYRPISILTCFSKIIEKMIYNRLMTFFFKHKVIYPHRFGFQSKIFTSHVMLDWVTDAYDNIDLNLHTGFVFIDLKKAFNTVCHKIFLNKLAHYGIRGVAFKLLSSYLTYRKQFVNFNRLYSELKNIKYGVPQGSSLGPLLFLIYVNDLQNAVDCTFRLFADDICLIFQASNPFIL